MKKLLYLLAALLLVSITINIVMLTNTNKIELNKKDVESIIIVNAFTGKAKQITRKEDIEAICNTINTTDMHIVKNPISKAGGTCYLFFINCGRYQKIISYLYGELMLNNGNYYRINSTKLEDFWNLKYKEENFRFSGIY